MDILSAYDQVSIAERETFPRWNSLPGMPCLGYHYAILSQCSTSHLPVADGAGIVWLAVVTLSNIYRQCHSVLQRF